MALFESGDPRQTLRSVLRGQIAALAQRRTVAPAPAGSQLFEFDALLLSSGNLRSAAGRAAILVSVRSASSRCSS